ncbi:MAG TPA: hypothetical protein VK961_07895 [Chthoniobacter sp.]|nr:hypothetical protein [Chthoniobacter sp.]
MKWLEFVFYLLDWIDYWRFNLCFLGGLFFAVIVYNAVPYDPLRWIVAGFIAVVGVVIGHRWQYSRYR